MSEDAFMPKTKSEDETLRCTRKGDVWKGTPTRNGAGSPQNHGRPRRSYSFHSLTEGEVESKVTGCPVLPAVDPGNLFEGTVRPKVHRQIARAPQERQMAY